MLEPVWTRETVPLPGAPGKTKISGSPLGSEVTRVFKVELERVTGVLGVVLK